jgi:uncharacterized lipoprotein YmbA
MRQKRALCGLALLLAGSCLAVACGSAPPTHYYVLAPGGELAHRSAPAGKPDGLRIGVEPLTVDPPYDRDQLVYRMGTDSVEVGFYEYHRWAAPLGELLCVALAEGLRGTPGIAAIEPVTASGSYDAFLRGRVVYLEEIDLPHGQQARVQLELRLVDPDALTLWSQEVAGSAEGQNDAVAEIVDQLYRAFEQALQEARTGLAEASSAWTR